jgi:hypothetical protein
MSPRAVPASLMSQIALPVNRTEWNASHDSKDGWVYLYSRVHPRGHAAFANTSVDATDTPSGWHNFTGSVGLSRLRLCHQL